MALCEFIFIVRRGRLAADIIIAMKMKFVYKLFKAQMNHSTG